MRVFGEQNGSMKKKEDDDDDYDKEVESAENGKKLKTEKYWSASGTHYAYSLAYVEKWRIV